MVKSMQNSRLRILVLIGMLLLLIACVAKPPMHDNSKFSTDASFEWPTFGYNLANQRFFPSHQINRDNVSKLKLAWQVHTGVKASFQTTPIVQNGIMYVSLPFNHVLALDAMTGKALWRYEHKRRKDWAMCCGPANRGVAVHNGFVVIGTVDARLIALDARTGQVIWDIDAVEHDVSTEIQKSLNSQDPNSARKVTGGTGVGIAMAPVIHDNLVIVGITGVGYGLHIDNPSANAPLGAVIGVTGRYGRPGFLAAFDIRNGKRVWQFDTIPAQGWEGPFSQMTDDGIVLNRDIAAEKNAINNYPDAARFGGGSAWSTPAIDPIHGLLYFGTGNPSPQMNDQSRPGDNLYTVSLIALEIRTGKIRWHYQQVPHDLWGYDLASPPVLFNFIQGNKTTPAVAQASKTGWVYIHDRMNGKLLLKSEPFVPQHNMFHKASKEGAILFPGILGGANWSPVAIDQAKQKLYVAAIHAPVKYTQHQVTGNLNDPELNYAAAEPVETERWGLLSCIDLVSGKVLWQKRFSQPLIGGVLATAGGLVFVGEGNGQFNALDADTGDQLWQSQTEAGVNAPPISYQLAGKQFVAVAAGGNAIFGYPQGDILNVYSLSQ